MVFARLVHVKEDCSTVCVLRLVLGSLAAANIATFLPHAGYLYGSDGVYPNVLACTSFERRLSVLCYVDQAWFPTCVIVLALVSATLFAVGLYTSVFKWSTPLLFASVTYRNSLPLAGDQVFWNFLFLLALSNCGGRYSVDAWLRSGRFSGSTRRQEISAWPRYLMILQLTLVYTINGWVKIGPTYQQGSAAYYLFANQRFQRVPITPIVHQLAPYDAVATWGELFFERYFWIVPLVLAVRRFASDGRMLNMAVNGTRALAVALAIAFHGSLMIFANLGWFVPATLACSLVLFSGDEIATAFRRFSRETYRLAPSRENLLPLRPNALWTRAVGSFVLFHAMAITIAAVPVQWLDARPLRGVVRHWLVLTNTHQWWRMFSPDVPRETVGVRFIVTRTDGTEHVVAWDPRSPDNAHHAYVGLNRLEKVVQNLLKSNSPFRTQHMAFICHLAGNDSAEVRMYRVTRRIPEWHKPYESHPILEQEILRSTCITETRELSDVVEGSARELADDGWPSRRLR